MSDFPFLQPLVSSHYPYIGIWMIAWKFFSSQDLTKIEEG